MNGGFPHTRHWFVGPFTLLLPQIAHSRDLSGPSKSLQGVGEELGAATGSCHRGGKLGAPEVVFPAPRCPVVCPGGSYKKIGYYDSTKDDLSWSKTDKWIGKWSMDVFLHPLNSHEHLSQGGWQVP